MSWLRPARWCGIASRNCDGISRAAELAIAPYGEGDSISAAVSTPELASSSIYLFGGTSRDSHVEIYKGALRLALREGDAKDIPVQRIQVNSGKGVPK